MTGSPLVQPTWLASHLHDPELRIVDVRWYLSGKNGQDEYSRGHIPGAVYLDLDKDLSSPRQNGPGRHPLPTTVHFAEVLARIGVTPRTTLVAYDDAGGAIASRLWWLLRYFGLAPSMGRILDGGLQAWSSQGYPLSTEVPSISPSTSVPSLTPGHTGVVDKSTVDKLRHDPKALLLDARAAERYRGENETVDPRAGHIPGAISAPHVENRVSPAGPMRSPEELAQRYRELGAFDAQTIVCYCGSGVTACNNILALSLAGRDDVLLYEGSWSDWSSDPTLPAATTKNRHSGSP